MSDAFPQPPITDAQETNPDARTMAMLAHLLALFTGFLGLLIVWLIKKDQYPFVNDQGKESLNFQITIVLATLVAGGRGPDVGLVRPVVPVAVRGVGLRHCVLHHRHHESQLWSLVSLSPLFAFDQVVSYGQGPSTR
ncbi:MAG: DUF4870 domain-containing protein [Pirellulales bacterium]|nr:DUF4870 domain-containing protein [Pirellulales bacterium]